MRVTMDLNTIGIDPDLYNVLKEAAHREYDVYHILDSMSEHQLESKAWLVENVMPFILEKENINVQLYGGWVAFPIVSFLHSVFDIGFIENIDLDENSIVLFKQYMRLKNYEHYGRPHNTSMRGPHDMDIDLVINTSSEHMPDMKELVKDKYYKRKPLFAIQSNNMFHIDDHINCVNDRYELIEKSGLSDIKYSGKLKMSNGYERYMVIGYA